MAIAPTNKELQLRLACGLVEKMVASGIEWTLNRVLESFPELKSVEESLVEIAYHEFCLREELGTSGSFEDWYAQYPALAVRLRRLFEFHQMLAEEESEAGDFDLESVTAWPPASPPLSFLRGEVPGLPVTGSHLESLLKEHRHSFLLKDYVFLDVVGQGSSSIVYHAMHRRLGRQVAIKALRSNEPTVEERTRFYAEATAFARLQHPNIVQIFEIGMDGNIDFIVMEYVGNQTLCDRIDRPCTPHRVAEIMYKLADAIATVHQARIIHRDLKPANILLDAQGNPKIADFGLAKISQSMEDFMEMTGSCVLVGTPAYMSPEQVQGIGAKIGPSVDIFALGIIHYELLTGKRPFESHSAFDTLKAIHSLEPTLPTAINPQIPRDLETIALKCLQKIPGDRYVSADELRDDLRRFLNRRPIMARRYSPWRLASKWISNNRLFSVSAFLTLTLISALFVVYRVQSTKLKLAQAKIAAEYENIAEQSRRAQAAEDAFVQSLANTRAIMNRWASLGEQLHNSPDLAKIGKQELEAAVAYYQQIIAQNTEDKSLYPDAARALMRVGLLRSEMGKWSESLQELTQAKFLLSQLEKDPKSDRLEAECDIQIGNVNWRLERMKAARDAYDSARTILESLHQSFPGDMEVATELANAIVCLSKMKASEGQWAECLNLYLYSLVVQQSAFRRKMGLEDRMHVAVQPSVEIDPKLIEQEIDECLQLYESLNSHHAEPHNHFSNVEYLEGFAFSLDGLGVSLAALNKTDLASKALSASHQFRALNYQADSKNPDRVLNLAESKHRLGLLLSRRYLGSDALGYYEAAYQLMNDLCEQFPDRVNYKIVNSDMLVEFAKGCRDISDYRESLAAAGKAIGMQEQLVFDFPDATFLKRKLSRSLEAKGLAHYCLQEDEEAIAALHRAVEIVPSSSSALNNLSWILSHTKNGDPQANLEFAQRAFAAEPNMRILNTLAFALYRAGQYEEAYAAQKRVFDQGVPFRASDGLVMALIEARIGRAESSQFWMDKAIELRLREGPNKVAPQRIEQDIRREIDELIAKRQPLGAD